MFSGVMQYIKPILSLKLYYQMGGKQFQKLETEEWREGEWQKVEGKPNYFGRCSTLRSRRTGALIDEYHLSWTNQQEYLFYLKSFNWRHRSRNQGSVVSSAFLRQQNKASICSGRYSANVYIEHIVIRFSQIQQIPISDILYILCEAIDGYQQIYQYSGYFRLNQQQICIDRTGKVKVWVNANLSKNYPEIENLQVLSGRDETNMVQRLFDIVVINTDPDEQPPVSLIQFLSRVRVREGHQIGFQYAKVVVLEYARMYNIPISTRFQTIHDLYKDRREENQNIGAFKSPPQRYKAQQYTPPQPLFNQSNYYQPLPVTPKLMSLLSAPTYNASPPVYYYPQIPPRPFSSYIPQNVNIHSNPPNPEAKRQQKISAHLEDIKEDIQSMQSKPMSRKSKAQAACQEETTQNQSHPFIDQQLDDRNTMRSVPIRNHSSSYHDHSVYKQRVRYSQIIEDFHSQNHEYKQIPINQDAFGLVNNPRARMKGSSSSSYKIVSSNSSRNNSCNRCSSFRSSEKMSNRKSKQSSNKESERRWPLKIIRYYTSMDHDEVEQLDPEIEADLRLFIG